MHLFDQKYALSSCRGQLLESGVKSERCNADRCAGAQLKNREVSFLTRILGRMTLKYYNLLFLSDELRVLAVLVGGRLIS